jgi:hypothetical protein
MKLRTARYGNHYALIGLIAAFGWFQVDMTVKGQAALPSTAQGAGTGPASSLIGLSDKQVRAALGSPKVIRNGVWYFDASNRTLVINFANGLVSAVVPADFELGILTAKTASERAAYSVAYERSKIAAAEADRKAMSEKAAAEADASKKLRELLAAERASAKQRADDEALAERKRREAEPLARITESTARELLTKAAREAKNDPNAFTASALSAIAALSPEFGFVGGLQKVIASDALDIDVAGPVFRLMSDLRERVRKFEALVPSPAWAPEMVILVGPKQIGSPDIEKIIVQRNGEIVSPLRTTLSPRVMVTAIGAKQLIHSGTVSYPLSAFEPGAGVSVTIVAIPASGANITKTFGSLDLRALQ